MAKYDSYSERGTPRTSAQNRALLDSERRAGFDLSLRETIGNRMKHNAESVLERIHLASEKIKSMKKYTPSFINEARNADKERRKVLHVVSKLHEMESQISG
jgi:hypothetical protein